MSNWMISDLKPDAGMFLDPEGLSWTDEGSALSMGVLGCCGCGRPEDTARWVGRGLEVLSLWASPDVSTDEWRARVREQFGSDEAAYFFWYWCDNQKLSEHGGSVPGWLTDRGKAVLADIKRILPPESDDEG